ncbi:MAG: efflux RND transporter periplasmic adaptor subunit [Bacteroidia bacterium]|nr:efflux RND transporter periplasmic adaptor subunit [Bacteroidia bacterium]
MIKNIKTKILFVFIVAFMSCKQSSKQESEEDAMPIVTRVIKLDTLIKRQYVCVVKAYQHTEIRALEKGYLEKIYVDEGKPVKKGQIMFQILPNVYRAEKDKAKAEFEYAEIEYLNAKQLSEKNVISPNELKLVKAKLEKARAELSLADAHYSFTEIRAPFDGLMDKFNVRLGALLDEGEVLTTISDISKLWVYFNMPEVEYLNFKKTFTHDSIIKVKLLMANNEFFPYEGVIETIEADFDSEAGNIAFRASFPNPEKLLRHGETGNIILEIPYKSAIIIPQKATFEILEKKYVYTVSNDNKVHLREIQVADEIPDLFIIKKGLKENEKIIVEGIRNIKDGEILKEYKETDPKILIHQLKNYTE